MKKRVTHLFLQRRPSGLFSVNINPLCCRLFIFACGLKDSRVKHNQVQKNLMDGSIKAYLIDEKISILLHQFTRQGEAEPRTVCIFLESYNKYFKVTVKTKYRKNYLRSCVFFHVGFLSRNLDFPVTAPGARSKWFSGYCPRLIRQEDPNRTMGRRQEDPSDHLTFWDMVIKKNSKTERKYNARARHIIFF